MPQRRTRDNRMKETLAKIQTLQDIGRQVERLRRDAHALSIDVQNRERLLEEKRRRAEHMHQQRMDNAKTADATQLQIEEAEANIARLKVQLNVTRNQKEYDAIQRGILSNQADIQKWEDEGLVALQAVDELAEEERHLAAETLQAEQELRKARDELELRVKERTKELSQTIDTLQEEVRERTRLEQEVLRIGELERHRIGRDLHDSLGQMLSGISCLTQVLHRKLESKSIDEATDAARIESIAVDSIKLTRSIAKGLNPIEQSPDGLMIAMREMASNTENMFAVNCLFDCSEPVLLGDHVVATHIHRIAQEAVTNAVRHGQAKNIRVALAASDGHVLLTVSDDGLGMPENITTSSGIGLRTMRYRAESIQASLNIGQSPTGETIISCKVPMEITDDR